MTTDVILTWDPNPAKELIDRYSVYELTSVPPVKLMEVVVPKATISNVSSGEHVYCVTATNLRGESGKSNPAAVPAEATVPQNVKVVVTVLVA